jgi:hypothetical protein
VVEHQDAVRQDERVVVRQRRDARAELDPLRALRRSRDEHLGRGDGLEPAGVVLADPRLIEAETIEVLHQLQVPVQRERGVLPREVHGRQEDPEPQRVARPVRAVEVVSHVIPQRSVGEILRSSPSARPR